MKVLVVGPSDTGSRGGMAQVIGGIREDEFLNREFHIDIHPSYIDGSLAVRLGYSAWRYAKFLACYRRYDLFHIHMAERGSTFRKYLYLLAAKKAGKRVIVHIHGAEYLTFYDSLGKAGKRIVDRLFHQADLVLALSEHWKRELESRFHIDTIRILHNGVDLASLQTAVTDVGEHPDSFLMLGRMGGRKGTYDLVDAVEVAARENPRLKVCIAGDGETETVRALVAKKGLGQNITVLGWIDKEEKLERLRNASTVVLPSYYEGLPLSILEGMAAGKAILSTTVGAIPEVVDEENGILIRPGDVKALAKGLLYCSSDKERLKAMSENNRQKAKNDFSTSRMYRQLADYYRQVME